MDALYKRYLGKSNFSTQQVPDIGDVEGQLVFGGQVGLLKDHGRVHFEGDCVRAHKLRLEKIRSLTGLDHGEQRPTLCESKGMLQCFFGKKGEYRKTA